MAKRTVSVEMLEAAAQAAAKDLGLTVEQVRTLIRLDMKRIAAAVVATGVLS